jgi:hypothetical protein
VFAYVGVPWEKENYFNGFHMKKNVEILLVRAGGTLISDHGQH